jgi:hypothetical protein
MKKLLIIFAIIIVAISSKAITPKIVAGQLIYTYQSPLHYKVQLVLYANCHEAIPVGNIPMMVYSQTGAGTAQTVQLIFDVNNTNNGLLVKGACLNTECMDSLNVCDGFLEYTFIANVILDTISTDWTFQVNVKRDNSLTNINISNNGSIITTLNNVARPSNNSSISIIDQFIILGTNMNATYLSGPYDPDNDSLALEIHETLDSSSFVFPQNTNFNSGFTLQNPLGATSVYSLNQSNGSINFTAQQVGNFQTTIKTIEYDRNSQQILGTKYADILFCISPCYSRSVNFINANAPYIDTMTGASFSADTVNDINASVGYPFMFEIKFTPKIFLNYSVVASDYLTTAIGSNFTFIKDTSINKINTIRLSWTPQITDTGMHTVKFIIDDSLPCTHFTPIEIPVKIKVAKAPLAISDISNSKNISIYPNPTSNTIFIQNKNKYIAKGTLEIRNIMNEIVYTNNENLIDETISINCSAFKTGIYFVINKMDNSVMKFVVGSP